MARLLGVDIPDRKRSDIALTYIYGIGRKTAKDILKKANLDGTKRLSEFTEDDLGQIRRIIEAEYPVEGDLRAQTGMNIKRLVDINCYRGTRHRRGLPARGQRTKTNARTRKGPRKTVAGKKKATKK